MRDCWCHPTAWRTGWCPWAWSEATEGRLGWSRRWAASATTRRPSPSRTSVSRRPWTATTWSRWTPTRRQATSTTAAPVQCPTAGTPTWATAGRAPWGNPTPGAWPLPARGRTPLNSSTSSRGEVGGRGCGLPVRMKSLCETRSIMGNVESPGKIRGSEPHSAALYLENELLTDPFPKSKKWWLTPLKLHLVTLCFGNRILSHSL